MSAENATQHWSTTAKQTETEQKMDDLNNDIATNLIIRLQIWL